MEDSRLMNFALHYWVKYQRFKGAAAISAMLLNVFLFVFKLAVCGAVVLIFAPHLIANKLRRADNRNALNKVLHVLSAAVCLALDVPTLLLSVAVIVEGVRCLMSLQILTGIVIGTIGIVVGVWTLKCLIFLFTKPSPVDDEVEDEQDVENETEDDTYDEDEDLRFCQLFRIGDEMCLLIDHVEMCPDETAFIRVVDDEGYTPIYKRKVKRDKFGSRFIVFNGYNCYLDDAKTHPIVPKK